jgi:hypothetical protein
MIEGTRRVLFDEKTRGQKKFSYLLRTYALARSKSNKDPEILEKPDRDMIRNVSDFQC